MQKLGLSGGFVRGVWRQLRMGGGRYMAWLKADLRRVALSSAIGANLLAVAVAGIVDGGGSEMVLTTSRYISWMTGSTEADAATARDLACESPDTGGVVLLAFGKQVEGGTRSFDGAEALYGYEHLAAVSAAYAEGLSVCTSKTWTLAIATSNYLLNDPARALSYGIAWERMVAEVAARGIERVAVVGGIDLEPGWGGVGAALAWLQGYRSGGTALVANASADGCPQQGRRGGCANGWTVELLAQMVWGRAGDAVLPQIYRKDGAQARQWGVIARNWTAAGGEPVFAGVMTQVRACELVRNENCPSLSLDPQGALEQLNRELGGEDRVVFATDVGWG